ncbi:porin family protein [Algoriphagus sp. SE2]|uniref:porin family protein n=1 Tax=Algoriphagus sp. SE2 TaxID=3141536 RepID=UPI0031CD1235
MKKILFTIAFLSFAFVSYSQDFSIGPKVGISQTNLDLSKENFESGDAKFGYHVGLFGRVGFGGFFLQPEVLYTQTKGKFSFDNMGSGQDEDYESTFNRLDIPVMLGFKLFNFLRLQAGPIASINMNSELKNAVDDVEDVDFEKSTLGYQAGIGLDIGNMIIDAKYESSLNKLTSNVGSFSTDQRINQWILSVGFRLF